MWGQPDNPFGVPGIAPMLDRLLLFGSAFLAIGVFGCTAAFVTRFRRSAGIERQQMKWLVYALGIFFLILALSLVIWILWSDLPWGTEMSIVIPDLGILCIAVATAIAILQHKLYDIDLVINRTLVYSALTVSVVTLYGLVVGTLGVIFQVGSNWYVSLLATGLAAILVQPLRDRLQRLINHMMYGERDDPYAVLSKLSRRLEGSLPLEATFPAVVETVAQALKLPYVAIALALDGGLKISASYGSAVDTLIRLPLIYQGETVGQLILSPRSPPRLSTQANSACLRISAPHWRNRPHGAPDPGFAKAGGRFAALARRTGEKQGRRTSPTAQRPAR